MITASATHGGARAMVLPGLPIGEGSREHPLFLVEAGTVIGPLER